MLGVPSVFGGDNKKTYPTSSGGLGVGGASRTSSTPTTPFNVSSGGLGIGSTSRSSPGSALGAYAGSYAANNTPIPLPFNPTAGFDPSLLNGLGDLIPPDPFGEAQGALQTAILNMNMRRQQQLMDAADAEARAGAGATQAHIGVEREKLDLQRSGLDRQIPLIDELFGAREGQRASDTKYLDRVAKQNEADYTHAMSVLDQELANLGIAASRATTAQQRDAASRGSVATQGNTELLGDISRKKLEGEQNIGNKRFEAGSARERAAASIEQQYSDIGFQARIDKAQTAEEKAKIYDQYKLLDLMAKDLDISAGQVASQLDAALKKNKAQWGNLDSLTDALLSGDPLRVKAATQFINDNYPQGLG